MESVVGQERMVAIAIAAGAGAADGTPVVRVGRGGAGNFS